MKLKKWKKYSVLIVYLFACFLHFSYDWFPNNFVACLSAVNESIWEHMKLTFNAFLMFYLLEYIILKKKKVQVNNYLFSILSSSLTSILITLVLFYPLYYNIGHNFFITQTIYIISIICGTYISYLVLTKTKKDIILSIISLLSILFMEFSFIYLTFNPKYEEIFIDRVTNKIGLIDLN